MNKGFEKNIKKYYSEKELTDHQFSRLDDLQKEGEWRWYLKPAFLGAAVATLLIFLIYRPELSSQKNIFKEVVKNHKKGMPSEVLSSNYTVLNEAMDKLDFKIVSSSYINKNFKTIGARYCSVQGKIAAQIRLQNIQTKSFYTLYQYLPPRTDKVKEGQQVVKDVEAKIWKEGEVMFVLAGPKI